jgi:hypothetical protein
MAEPDKKPVTMEELLVSSLAQTDALAKLLIEKGLITRRRVYAEDFRGTGDVSEALQSHAPMNRFFVAHFTCQVRLMRSSVVLADNMRSAIQHGLGTGGGGLSIAL